jgi:hypothetical protein
MLCLSLKTNCFYQKRILPGFAKAPQPFRRGGSSKFQYYPHLLALSNPKKNAGVQSEIKSQYGGFVLTGGGVSEIEAGHSTSCVGVNGFLAPKHPKKHQNGHLSGVNNHLKRLLLTQEVQEALVLT